MKIIDEPDFRAEASYRAVMHIVGMMLKSGLITEDEKSVIDTAMLEKYRPVLGLLLSGKPLI